MTNGPRFGLKPCIIHHSQTSLGWLHGLKWIETDILNLQPTIMIQKSSFQDPFHNLLIKNGIVYNLNLNLYQDKEASIPFHEKDFLQKPKLIGQSFSSKEFCNAFYLQCTTSNSIYTFKWFVSSPYSSSIGYVKSIFQCFVRFVL